MKSSRLLVLLLMLFLASCISGPDRSTATVGFDRELRVSRGGYVRYDGIDSVAGDVESAVRTFESDRFDMKITLLGMLHIADEGFYRQVEERIAGADCVLTEGVQGPPGRLGGLGRALQAAEILRSRLDLAGQKQTLKQVRGISYFWGDTSFDEFIPTLEVNQAVPSVPPLFLIRGVIGFLDILLYANGVFGQSKSNLYRHIGATAIVKPGDHDATVFDLLRRHRGDVPLTPSIMEEYLTELETLVPDATDSEREEILEQVAEEYGILIYRNDRLFAELENRLAEGHWQHVIIPWGAAHLWDLQERIEQQLGYRLTTEEWLPAWRIQSRE